MEASSIRAFMETYIVEIRWAAGVMLLLLALFGRRLLHRVTSALERKLGAKSPAAVRILAHGFTEPLIAAGRVALLLAAALVLPLPFTREKILQVTLPTFEAIMIALGAWGFWRAAPLCNLPFRGAEKAMERQSRRTLARFIENIYRVVVVLAALLSVLDRFGLPVVSLIAGAGVVGLAVSLAAQSTLSNLIAGVTIVIERPFSIGDYIILDGMEGTVEDISFRATRLRTPDQMLVTVDNSNVLSGYIQNASNRQERLWTFNLVLTYDADSGQVERFRQGLEELLRRDSDVVSDTVQVALDAFADSGLNISVRLYVKTVALADYRELKNRLNLQIMSLFEETGCELAYPSTMVYRSKDREA